MERPLLKIANNVFFIVNFMFTLIAWLTGATFGYGSSLANTYLALTYMSWVVLVFALVNFYLSKE
jgi:hypothetical protein